MLYSNNKMASWIPVQAPVFSTSGNTMVFPFLSKNPSLNSPKSRDKKVIDPTTHIPTYTQYHMIIYKPVDSLTCCYGFIKTSESITSANAAAQPPITPENIKEQFVVQIGTLQKGFANETLQSIFTTNFSSIFNNILFKNTGVYLQKEDEEATLFINSDKNIETLSPGDAGVANALIQLSQQPPLLELSSLVPENLTPRNKAIYIGEIKATVETLASRMESWWTQKQWGGGSKKKNGKKTKTSERVMINGKERVVYLGARGGKYIKKGGEFVPLRTASSKK